MALGARLSRSSAQVSPDRVKNHGLAVLAAKEHEAEGMGLGALEK